MKLIPRVFPSPFKQPSEEIQYVHRLSERFTSLKKSGVKYIGLYTDNDAYMYYSILAIWKAGCAFVPINHKFPIDRLKTIIKETGISAIIGNSKSVEAITTLGVEHILINDDIELSNNFLNDDSTIEITLPPEAPAYVLFTSGSTGVPKGIPISFKNISSFTEDIKERFPLTSSDKVLQTFELSFDVSIGNAMMAWASGACLYICPLDGIIPVDAIKMTLEYKVNVIITTPSTVNILKKYRILGEVDLSFVDVSIFTGEAVPLHIINDWKKTASNSSIINAYGPTETTIWATFHEYKESDVISDNGLIPIGKASKYIDAHLYQDESVSSNPLQGELWLGGSQVFDGYINNPEKTKQALTSIDGKKYYRSGDLVQRMEDGGFIYLNRLDNQVKIQGYRVELGEVEFKIKQLLNISSCVVFAISDENDATWLMAIMEKPSFSNEEKQLIQENITYYMMPRKFVTVDQMPVNHSGKIDRQLLKAKYVTTTV